MQNYLSALRLLNLKVYNFYIMLSFRTNASNIKPNKDATHVLEAESLGDRPPVVMPVTGLSLPAVGLPGAQLALLLLGDLGVVLPRVADVLQEKRRKNSCISLFMVYCRSVNNVANDMTTLIKS